MAVAEAVAPRQRARRAARAERGDATSSRGVKEPSRFIHRSFVANTARTFIRSLFKTALINYYRAGVPAGSCRKSYSRSPGSFRSPGKPRLLALLGVHHSLGLLLICTGSRHDKRLEAMVDADDHLAMMREKMAAMAAAAEVSALQSRLAMNIKSSMERIDRIMEDDTHDSAVNDEGEDDEVAAWRRKIEELSKPASPTKSVTSTSSVPTSQRHGYEELQPVLLVPSSPRAAPLRDVQLTHDVDEAEAAHEAAAAELAAEDATAAKPDAPPSLLRRCVGCFMWRRGPGQYGGLAVEEPEEDHHSQHGSYVI